MYKRTSLDRPKNHKMEFCSTTFVFLLAVAAVEHKRYVLFVQNSIEN